METRKPSKGLGIGTRSFLAALAILFALMCVTYAMTFFIPGGEYDRVIDDGGSGSEMIDSHSFRYTDGGLPFWKWLCSPILVLGAEGGGTVIAVIAFLLVIGGVFNALEKSGIMKYMLNKIVDRFGGVRYALVAVVTLFFMAMGAFIGSYEECVPLVPIVVALSVALGFDALTGLGMSLLAIGCGFASGVCNPFTIGVAQQIAGLPMFSGMWLRFIAFVLIYGLVVLFVGIRAKKIATPIEQIRAGETFVREKNMDRALVAFACVLGTGILAVLLSVWITVLQDYTMIIVAVMFFVAGVLAALISGMKLSALGSNFVHGFVSILPAVLMILMASSIKYTLTEAKVLDTLLHSAVEVAQKLPRPMLVLFIYLIVLIMNFFISSGSAKAFLLMPLIVPLSNMFEISSQLSVLAFGFGDGFSNILYPTNPVLLISLGLAGVSYTRWLKWTWKIQLAILLLTTALLMLGYAVGY
jgi:uncharacterized ion transporter superfamily protein YfcC